MTLPRSCEKNYVIITAIIMETHFGATELSLYFRYKQEKSNMKIPFYQIDAFTSKLFRGNPAAICLLEAWLDDNQLQSIAAENNLSETAFLVLKSKGRYDLRWFTPTMEVDLCGHATLASAFVIFSFIDRTLTSADFETASGLLSVTKSDQLLSMDFPARKPE